MPITPTAVYRSYSSSSPFSSPLVLRLSYLVVTSVLTVVSASCSLQSLSRVPIRLSPAYPPPLHPTSPYLHPSSLSPSSAIYHCARPPISAHFLTDVRWLEWPCKQRFWLSRMDGSRIGVYSFRLGVRIVVVGCAGVRVSRIRG